jgi:hypothetical protein
MGEERFASGGVAGKPVPGADRRQQRHEPQRHAARVRPHQAYQLIGYGVAGPLQRESQFV